MVTPWLIPHTGIIGNTDFAGTAGTKVKSLDKCNLVIPGTDLGQIFSTNGRAGTNNAMTSRYFVKTHNTGFVNFYVIYV